MQLPANKKDQILSLLTQYTALIAQEMPISIHTYKDMRDDAVHLELHEELKKLAQLFSDEELSLEAIQTKFKFLCKERQIINEDTCLSYGAQPEGACNELYWEIAKIVFEPKSLREMIRIILPNITKVMQVVVQDVWVKHLVGKEVQEIKDQARCAVEDYISFSPFLNEVPVSVSQLNEYVMSKNHIFPVSQLEGVCFSDHVTVHESLMAHEALREKIYRHNDDLKYIYQIMSFHRPAKLVMEFFVRELKSTGEKFSKAKFAADSALTALRMFKLYLKAHPNKSVLLALKDHRGSSLEDVINILEQSGCVEMAAESIEAILFNKAYQKILEENSKKENSGRDALVAKVNGMKITRQGYDDEKTIPRKYLEESIKKIELNNPYHFVEMILSIPSSHYSNILKSAKIKPDKPYHALPPEIAEIIESLGEQQQADFLKAIVENKAKLGGDLGLLRFSMSYKKKAFFDRVLEAVPEDKKSEIICNETLVGLAIKRNNIELFNSLFVLIYKSKASLDKKRLVYRAAIKAAVDYDNLFLYEQLIEWRSPNYFNFTFEEAFNQDHDMLYRALKKESAAVIEEILKNAEKAGTLYGLLNNPHEYAPELQAARSMAAFEAATLGSSYKVFEVIYNKIKNSPQPLFPLVGLESMVQLNSDVFDPYSDNLNLNDIQRSLIFYLLVPNEEMDAYLFNIVKYQPVETLNLIDQDYPDLVEEEILKRNQVDNTLLHQAAGNPDPRVLETLLLKLRQKDRYNELYGQINDNKQSPIAVVFNTENLPLNAPFIWDVNPNAEKIIDVMLVSIGADKHYSFYHDEQMYGFNILQLSVISNDVETFNKLKEHYKNEEIKQYLVDTNYRGADPAEKVQNKSPLHYLFSYDKNNIELVDQVLNMFSLDENNEFIFNTKDSNGDDLFDYVCQYASAKTFNLVVSKLKREDFINKNYLLSLAVNQNKYTVMAYFEACKKLSVDLIAQVGNGVDHFLYDALVVSNNGEMVVTECVSQFKNNFSKDYMIGLLKSNIGYFPFAAFAYIDTEDPNASRNQIEENFDALLEDYDAEQRFAILNHKNSQGETLLHLIAENKTLSHRKNEIAKNINMNYRVLLKAILNSLPTTYCRKLLSEKNKDGKDFYDLMGSNTLIERMLNDYSCGKVPNSPRFFRAASVQSSSEPVSPKRKGSESPHLPALKCQRLGQ